MISVTYEEFIKKAKESLGLSFAFKCPICGEPLTVPLAQFNLSIRYPCENCHAVTTLGRPHYKGESLDELHRLAIQITEISINRPTYHGDKNYDGVSVRMKDGVPSVFGYTLKLEF
jgi:predicted RNA-binding Zn-ribbon protein involved in translation (DUF1610 family)